MEYVVRENWGAAIPQRTENVFSTHRVSQTKDKNITVSKI